MTDQLLDRGFGSSTPSSSSRTAVCCWRATPIICARTAVWAWTPCSGRSTA